MSRDKEFDFNEAVRALLREWRVTRRRKDGKTWGHKEMAAFLDITPVNQIAYETREKGSYPAFVLARFCQRAHMDAAALMDPAEPRLVPLPEQDIVG